MATKDVKIKFGEIENKTKIPTKSTLKFSIIEMEIMQLLLSNSSRFETYKHFEKKTKIS